MTPSQPLPFHPAYGLTDETRRQILADAERLGVVKAAALHGVHHTTVYIWRRATTLPPAPPVIDLWR